MSIKDLISSVSLRQKVIIQGQVVPDASRCVQCGLCSFHCPIGIDIRRHAWRGEAIKDSRCITCGECIERCPRGVLRFEKSNLFTNS
jgi:ferredoxin